MSILFTTLPVVDFRNLKSNHWNVRIVVNSLQNALEFSSVVFLSNCTFLEFEVFFFFLYIRFTSPKDLSVKWFAWECLLFSCHRRFCTCREVFTLRCTHSLQIHVSQMKLNAAMHPNRAFIYRDSVQTKMQLY